jgi:hypothetical protein
MIQFFKELYLTAFIIGFRIRAPERFRGGLAPSIDFGKGVLVVWLIIFFILKGIEEYVGVLFGTRFSFDDERWEMAVITLALYLPNYYVLVTRGYGTAFDREFTNFKKSKKTILVASCVGIMLASIVFCGYSDSAYRHSFHIIPK